MKAAKNLLALVAVLAVYGCAQPPAPEPMAMAGTPADEQAIRDMIERVETAWNAKDAATMASLVTEDYNAINPEGRHTMGRAAYEANTQAEFAAERPEGMALSVDTGYVQWHGADAAAVGGTWTVTGVPMEQKGSWMAVVKRSGDQWQMSNGLVATFVPEPAGDSGSGSSN
jgi:uncharacterized protein (TIGR02246 family)